MFEAFYNQLFDGRRLAWMHSLGRGEVKINYLSRPYVAFVNTCQMAVLLAFNDSRTLSGKALQVSTQMELVELQRTIKALLDKKILKCHLHEEDINEESTFSLNMDFCSKQIRLQMKMPTDSNSDSEVCAREVESKIHLQAVIVRIMKLRKVLRHSALIQEVMNYPGIRFKPVVGMIKKCIEVLIDMDYIERSSQSWVGEYRYLA